MRDEQIAAFLADLDALTEKHHLVIDRINKREERPVIWESTRAGRYILADNREIGWAPWVPDDEWEGA